MQVIFSHRFLARNLVFFQSLYFEIVIQRLPAAFHDLAMVNDPFRSNESFDPVCAFPKDSSYGKRTVVL